MVIKIRYYANRRFGGKYRLRLQRRRKRRNTQANQREQMEQTVAPPHAGWLVDFFFLFYPEDGSGTFPRNVG
jgi:hypothetical protein